MKYSIAILLVSCTLGSLAQKAQPQDSIPFELKKQSYLYSMGTKYNDVSIARMALYNILVLDPTNSAILDSLAVSYLDYQEYVSAALVAQDAVAINPNDMFATEVAAVSFESLGVKAKSVTFYEKLYLNNNNLGTLYKIAFMQMDLKRFAEAKSNADAIIESAEAEKLNLIFPKDDQNRQEISMKVAAIRLKGMLAEAQGNKEEALGHFENALALSPDFTLVKEQIKVLKGE